MTPYATYNEYYAACKTVDKMQANQNRSLSDTIEMLKMIEQIKLTNKANEL